MCQPRRHETSLLDLPPEILHHLLPFLSLSSIAALAATSRSLGTFVTTHAFRLHALSYESYSPFTVAPSHRDWSWSRKAEWTCRQAARWDAWQCGAEVLGGQGRTWQRSCMPVIMLWEANPVSGRPPRVVVGKGPTIEMWEVDERGGSWNVYDGASHQGQGKMGRGGTQTGRPGLDDITGIAAVAGGHDDLLLSHVSGSVQRMRLDPNGQLVEVARYISAESGPSTVQALESAGGLIFCAHASRPRPHALPPRPTAVHLVSTAARHYSVSIQSISSPWSPPTSFAIPTKPWFLLPSLTSGTASPTWLAVGHSGPSPLSIYTLSSTGEPLPLPISYSTASKTSIYALTTPSLNAAHFRPDATVISAAYDSLTRIYDLRSSSLNPIVELSDPWSDDPLYSVASGGPSGSYIAVGTARNAIRLFDVRNPTNGGITAFAPTRERSPVYGVVMEHSRVWAVVERRAFVVDFEGGRRELEDVAYYGHEKRDVGLKKTGAGW